MDVLLHYIAHFPFLSLFHFILQIVFPTCAYGHMFNLPHIGQGCVSEMLKWPPALPYPCTPSPSWTVSQCVRLKEDKVVANGSLEWHNFRTPIHLVVHGRSKRERGGRGRDGQSGVFIKHDISKREVQVHRCLGSKPHSWEMFLFSIYVSPSSS